MRSDLEPDAPSPLPDAPDPEATSEEGGARHGKRRRVFEVLPTAVTLGNLFSGFLAIAYLTDSIDPHGVDRIELYTRAVGLIFLAMVFDAFDGKVARMTGVSSTFGAQVDSICDAVSFGAAPALLFKVIAEHEPGVLSPKLALGVAVVFLACAVLRLARFNVDTEEEEESHAWFEGLPTPAAAAVVASLAWLNVTFDPESAQSWVRWAMIPVTLAAALLMVSRVRYFHFAIWLFRRKTYGMLVALILSAIAIVVWLEILFPLLCLAYMVQGPLRHVWLRASGRASERKIF